MKIFALDLSLNAGWAILEDGKLLKYGLAQSKKLPEDYTDGTEARYPSNYYVCAFDHTYNILMIAAREEVDIVIVEETVPGKEVYSQKLLEFMHCCVGKLAFELTFKGIPVAYIRTGEWRKVVELRMSKEDKKNNLKKNRERAKLEASKIRKQIKSLGNKKINKDKVKKLKEKLSSLQTSKITRKHLSVRKANELFNLNLLQKDNDIADAILLGVAYFKGAKHADGLRPSKKNRS